MPAMPELETAMRIPKITPPDADQPGVDRSERCRLARLRTEQPRYSILSRSIERAILPVCDLYGLGVLTWSLLVLGLSTCKYRAKQNKPISPG